MRGFIRPSGWMWIETGIGIGGRFVNAGLAGVSSALRGGCGLKHVKLQLTGFWREQNGFIRPSGWMWIETLLLSQALDKDLSFHPPFGVDVD